MKKYAEISSIITICILLFACSNREITATVIAIATANSSPVVPSSTVTALPSLSKTPLPTFSAYSPKQIILNYSFGGVFDSFAIELGVVHSKVVVYADGQVILPGKPYRQKQLSNEEINELFFQLERLGFFTIETNQQHNPTDELYEFRNQYEKVYDGVSICLEVNYHKQRKLCTYEHYKEYLKPPMKEILRFMDDFEPKGLTIYQPDRLLLDVYLGRVTFIDENIKSVPWPANFPVLETDYWRVLEVRGEMAAKVSEFFGNTQDIKIIDEDDLEYTVEARPLLPHEMPSWP